MNELKGKTAVITGAASGIGRALAEAAAAVGMKIVAADIREDALADAVEALRDAGAQVTGVPVDVAREASVEALAEAAYAELGAVHLLVNNAGIAYAESAWDTPIAEYERMVQVNLFGVIYGVRAFVPRMLRGGEWGHVVNVASAAGLFTVPGFAAYSASKYAVVGLSEALYHDLAARKATVGASVLCPSWVRTRIADLDPSASSSDEITTSLRQGVADAVANGLEASDVAQRVLEGVVANRFYLLTHESTEAAVRARADDITEGRKPTFFMR